VYHIGRANAHSTVKDGKNGEVKKCMGRMSANPDLYENSNGRNSVEIKR
jgi:hypothetical protein